MSNPQRRCARCKSPLPENSGYCVGCGCDNGGVGEKLVKAHQDVERSKANTQRLARRSRFLWFLNWWS